MDGYAVRTADASVGAVLPVIGEAAAGSRFSGDLPDGAAVRIFTGAPVPEGADTILIQENTEQRPGEITVQEAPTAGEYVRPAGGDFREGQVLEAPRRLSPRTLPCWRR